jgi:hypothetical protein
MRETEWSRLGPGTRSTAVSWLVPRLGEWRSWWESLE